MAEVSDGGLAARGHERAGHTLVPRRVDVAPERCEVVLVGARTEWFIESFAPERGVGRVRSAATGEQFTFAIEAWSPCDAATARALQDSEHRRHLLMPHAGEPVEVEWSTARSGALAVGRVRRARPVWVPAPITFGAWLTALGRHVPDVRGWTEEEWATVFGSVDDDVEDAVRSSEPAPPEAHLAVLAWLRAQGPRDLARRRLRWVGAERPDAVALEIAADPGHVLVDLPRDVVERLVADGLAIVVPRGQDDGRGLPWP